MAEPDLTNDFNSTTSIFNRLFHLFTAPASSGTGTSADNGNSLFSGIENLLKFLFGWVEPQSQQPAATTPATSAPATPPPRSFMGRVKDNLSSAAGTIKDDFNAVTTGVGNFFHGAAFDISTAIGKLKNGCHSSSTGYCLASVENAMTAGGLRFSGGKTVADVLPSRGGSHWAKDLAPVLEHDGRFDEVTSGHGASFSSNYTPKVGDVAVWTGGAYGHTQMFTGYDKDGKQVWISDFKSSPGNWTGLRDPDSHGDFKIFRQKPAADATAVASAQPKPAPRQGLNA